MDEEVILDRMTYTENKLDKISDKLDNVIKLLAKDKKQKLEQRVEDLELLVKHILSKYAQYSEKYGVIVGVSCNDQEQLLKTLKEEQD